MKTDTVCIHINFQSSSKIIFFPSCLIIGDSYISKQFIGSSKYKLRFVSKRSWADYPLIIMGCLQYTHDQNFLHHPFVQPIHSQQQPIQSPLAIQYPQLLGCRSGQAGLNGRIVPQQQFAVDQNGYANRQFVYAPTSRAALPRQVYLNT